MAKKKYTKKELEYFEKILKDKRMKLVDELGYIEKNALYSSDSSQSGEMAGVTNHMAEAASDFNQLETNFDLAEREGKYLVYIEDALERIKQGTYGICKSCETLIPKMRLEVVPTATRCVACKQNVKVSERKALEEKAAKAAAARQAR